MFPETSTAISIKFLEGLNERLREEIAWQQARNSPKESYWPEILISGMVGAFGWFVGWVQ